MKIGFTVGVFDLLHVGHINLFKRCKQYCDILYVAVCDDEYVRNIKKKEPYYSYDDRFKILSELKCVDKVIPINNEEVTDKMLAWTKYKFDILFSGDDWKGSERYQLTEKQFKEVGVEIVYLPYTQGISTSDIKEKLKEKTK